MHSSRTASCTAPIPAPAATLPPPLLSMSADELRLEWRQQEDALVRYDRLVDAVIAALWGEDDELAEGPPPDDEVDGDTLVSGILSLHELNARLMLENEQLRVDRSELAAERDRWRQRCEDAEEQLRSALEAAHG